MNEIILEIVRVVLADEALREQVLSELDITDEAAWAIKEAYENQDETL